MEPGEEDSLVVVQTIGPVTATRRFTRQTAGQPGTARRHSVC